MNRLVPLLASAGLMLTAAVTRAQEAAGAVIHRVQPGDTIPRLGWKYRVRLDAIQAANPGVAGPLTVGQKLIIPLGGPTPPRAVPAALAVPVPRAWPVPPSAVEDAPPEPPLAEPLPAPSRQGDFLGEARRLSALGLRYNGRWTPPGQREAWVMDCSNTARWLYRSVANLDIGRTASDQYYFLSQRRHAWDVPRSWDGKPRLDYLRAHLRPGDLLFWENTYKPVRKPDITHVMVFLGADAQGRWQMAGSQTSHGVNVYHFDAQAPKGGYSSWFGLVRHEGRFVAYGRPLGGAD